MGGSKTDAPCDCTWLASKVDDGRWPILFDPLVNEYHFTFPTPHGPARAIIRHCPGCGGRAPESKRASLFARISPDEQRRLQDLIAPLKTVDDVLRVLGTPDHDAAGGMTTTKPETETRGAEHQVFRHLMYQGLSETALVRVHVLPGDAVSITFSGKYIGPPDPTATRFSIR